MIGGPAGDDDDVAATLAPSSRLVACALAQHINRDRKAWPGADELSRRTGLSDRAVREHLGHLRAAGFLELLEQGGLPGGRRSTLWRVAIPGRTWDRKNGWTPDTTSGVTPDESSGVVEDPTPDICAPTPDNDAPTPDVTSAELDELDEQEPRERGPEQLVAHYADEVPSLLIGLSDTHGPAAVREAVDELFDAGATFAYPSHLIEALRTRLTGSGDFDLSVYASGPAVPPMRTKDPSRFDLSASDDGAPVAVLVPDDQYERTPAERRTFLDALKEGTA